MFQGQAGRTAATAASLAIAGAATAASCGVAQAAPQQTPAQVKAQVDDLYQQAEAATQKYNGTKADAEKTRTSLDSLRDEAARTQARLNTARDALGSVVSAQYRSGGLDPSVQLALSPDPDTFLENASVAERAESRNAQAVQRVRAEVTQLGRLHSTADGRLTDLTAQQRQLARQKSRINEKLGAARRLLDRLSAPERARYEAGTANVTGPGTASTATAPGASAAPRSAAGPRAAAALAFAYGALGKPYVWGTTGPDAFDCSGLTQAAWKAAGVSLPRTTYTQINAGERVSKSQLAPGDLVFFYSGVSHVGLYVGGGKMIHAPHPGAPVRVAPIDEMPFAGATRPA
ncbi:C40 family peptidase [Streptomyces sp. 8L]|uniref:C40 family peptidase n=1 Tax=Streptomyces sp. 8L TaxID=2877242 RepID=UPI001CD7FED1|nr:NlpC/P60 family protein [Streptomyces sp. 8L]MCA1221260.1 NlpC/P60 family protein [Streptomyces sp. 8L]